MKSDGQQEEKKVRLRSNDNKDWTRINEWSNTHAYTNNRENEMGCGERVTTMVSNGKHASSVKEKWSY
jgi:hypothetical protein